MFRTKFVTKFMFWFHTVLYVLLTGLLSITTRPKCKNGFLANGVLFFKLYKKTISKFLFLEYILCSQISVAYINWS
jgi:hypothetical protein